MQGQIRSVLQMRHLGRPSNRSLGEMGLIILKERGGSQTPHGSGEQCDQASPVEKSIDKGGGCTLGGIERKHTSGTDPRNTFRPDYDSVFAITTDRKRWSVD